MWKISNISVEIVWKTYGKIYGKQHLNKYAKTYDSIQRNHMNMNTKNTRILKIDIQMDKKICKDIERTYMNKNTNIFFNFSSAGTLKLAPPTPIFPPSCVGSAANTHCRHIVHLAGTSLCVGLVDISFLIFL